MRTVALRFTPTSLPRCRRVCLDHNVHTRTLCRSGQGQDGEKPRETSEELLQRLRAAEEEVSENDLCCFLLAFLSLILLSNVVPSFTDVFVCLLICHCYEKLLKQSCLHGAGMREIWKGGGEGHIEGSLTNKIKYNEGIARCPTSPENIHTTCWGSSSNTVY